MRRLGCRSRDTMWSFSQTTAIRAIALTSVVMVSDKEYIQLSYSNLHNLIVVLQAPSMSVSAAHGPSPCPSSTASPSSAPSYATSNSSSKSPSPANSKPSNPAPSSSTSSPPACPSCASSTPIRRFSFTATFPISCSPRVGSRRSRGCIGCRLIGLRSGPWGLRRQWL